LPKLSLGTESSQDVHRDTVYVFDTVAFQPVLQCSLLSPKEVSLLPYTYYTSLGTINQSFERNGSLIAINPLNIDEKCSVASLGGSADLRFNVSYTAAQETWIGEYINMDNSTAGQVDSDCPSVGLLFGVVHHAMPQGGNVTGLICTQGINQVCQCPLQRRPSSWTGRQSGAKRAASGCQKRHKWPSDIGIRCYKIHYLGIP
jgi:hypothetical protein